MEETIGQARMKWAAEALELKIETNETKRIQTIHLKETDEQKILLNFFDNQLYTFEVDF